MYDFVLKHDVQFEKTQVRLVPQIAGRWLVILASKLNSMQEDINVQNRKSMTGIEIPYHPPKKLYFNWRP